jgi:heme/copper-type cytochrome/quinol oxidase subunit 1
MVYLTFILLAMAIPVLAGTVVFQVLDLLFLKNKSST